MGVPDSSAGEQIRKKAERWSRARAALAIFSWSSHGECYPLVTVSSRLDCHAGIHEIHENHTTGGIIQRSVNGREGIRSGKEKIFR